ncbi:UvrB/UvrC motif-containing protein [Bacillus thermotolerans]|uniref:UvrB/UvrC motif-containing protein n=1 Tax=Bacillus thermotolerans TaxID=1221996 RepID=UPI0005895DF0|nr:Nucleotide excision repair protein, with UvrB/UvrC motif [Bacillus thermotolerans]
MKCQRCNERPATLHFTKTINGEKSEIYLCEKCAKEQGEEYMFSYHPDFSIGNLLGGLFNIESPFLSKPAQYPQQQALKCEHCQTTFQEFVNRGKFGCPHCYETFQEQLTPILKRLQNGNNVHKGKIPKRMGGTLHVKKEIEELRVKLQQAIAHEEFESAASIRDQIRSLEKSLLSKGGEL